MTISDEVLHDAINLCWAILCGGLGLGVFYVWLRVNKIERQ